MSLLHSLTTFAAEYNCDAYGAGNFNDGNVCGASTAAAAGGLSNTGLDILIPVGIALIAITTSVVMIVKKRRTARQS